MTEEGIRLCGHHMKEEELNEIFLALDADGTGGGGWKRMSSSDFFGGWRFDGDGPPQLRNHHWGNGYPLVI